VIAHSGIALAVAATIIYNLGFILEKRALKRLPPIDAHHLWALLRTLFTAPAWLAGFVLICGGLATQLLVLSLEPLTIAQPLQASGVVVTIALSRVMLREKLGRVELACMGVIVVAVLLLGLSSGGSKDAAGTHAAGTAIAAAAVPACLLGLVIYWRTHRASIRRHRRYPVNGVSFGLCAGLMYGVAGLALKGLSAAVFAHPAGSAAGTAAGGIHTVAARGPAAPHGYHALLLAAVLSPYLYMLLACTAVGMVFFQTALQRSPASIVLPTSSIISIGYLVVIGSWLFHERLPAGPVPLAMRLIGGVAAVAVPIALTVVTERAARRRSRDRPRGLERPDPSLSPDLSLATDPSFATDPSLTTERP
jgi:drug/metabolite transporter (DMT)-like permease